MTSEVSISLSGPNFPFFTPIGASINYGINTVPTARVDLDPSSLMLFCNFDGFRRRQVQLKILTSGGGCLFFNGVVDGLSFSQSPGGLRASLILKHEVQWLTEFYPRIIGVHPASLNVFAPTPFLNVKSSDTNILQDQIKYYGHQLNFNQNVIDFYKDLLIFSVTVQVYDPLVENKENTTVGIQKILKEAANNRNNLIPGVTRLLNSIDTSMVKGLDISAASRGIATQTVENIASMRDDLFSNLVRLVQQMGCCVVAGGNKIFIVPEAAYLRTFKGESLRNRRRADRPNIVFPAEYDDFVFNDNGYVNIKGVYILHDQGTNLSGLRVGNNIDMGSFVDPYTNGNILVTSMPQLVSMGLVEAAALGGRGLQPMIKNRQQFISSKILDSDADINVEGSLQEILRDADKRTRYMDQWAQMEYCKLKYDDRTGAINTAFHNNWAPGAVGTLYTRQPGTYLDFFVTNVTHNFQLTAPSGGQATTTVNFKCGRMGASTMTGLDVIDLYKYDYAASQRFCMNFLTAVSNP